MWQAIVAALDYLMNVAGDWDQAVVAEPERIEILADAATLNGWLRKFIGLLTEMSAAG